MNSDLIERYIWAVAKDLPPDTREDVARELQVTIEDMVEARGSRNDRSIREVLVELGDPAELALRYGGKKRYLVGPALYSPYARLLKTLLLVIVPIVLVATLFERFWSGEDSVVSGILVSVSAAAQTGVLVAFWVTLVFVVLERTGAGSGEPRTGTGRRWDPDSLPPVIEKRQITFAETIVSLAVLSTLMVFILWQRSHPVAEVFLGDDWMDAGGGSIEFLAHPLWDFWIPVLLVVIVAIMAVEVWKYVSGRWTLPLVVTNLAVNALFAGVVVMILTTQTVVAPEFLTAFREHTDAEFPADVVGVCLLVAVVGICVWDSIDCVLKYLRMRRTAGIDRFAGDAA